MKQIRFQNVSKKFVIGKNLTIKRKFDEVMDRLRHRRDPVTGDDRITRNIMWALRDVSFEVKQGETLGLIGPNGSGKSTTLKLLAKITEPDSGLVDIQGTVVPLIEVGAGFHLDLTGRDNIYLNGSILGLKRADIDRQMDSIVDFAEIPQFLDTPLKKYSSGMSVRLGFAIAVHVNPDVLLVDEVLAVGDLRFQRKCITRMKEIVNSGKTVVFVSHNMAAVQSLCKRCVLLFNGKVAAYGESQNVVNTYLTNSYSREVSATPRADSQTRICSFLRVECQDPHGQRVGSVTHGEDLCIVVEFNLSQLVANARSFFTIHSADGATLYETDTLRLGKTINLPAGAHRMRVLLPKLALLPGIYSVTVSLSDLDNTVFYGFAPNVMDFEVTANQSNSPVGIVALPTEWELPA